VVRGLPRPAAASSGEQRTRRGMSHDLRRRLTIAALVVGLVLALLFAIPGLRPVADEIEAARPGWILLAVGLELASCATFVVVFRAFFDRLPAGAARALAWVSMASGALLPAGGVGGLAISGWLMSIMGLPAGWIVRRSSAVFVFTSAMNVVTLVAAGLLLLAGAGGPGDALHAGLPVLGAVVVIVLVITLARRAAAGVAPGGAATWRGELVDGFREAEAALRRPTWRLLGAVGYLWFDIAAMWAVLHAIGVPVPVGALVLGYLIGYLANALPVPGGVGVLDAGLAGALALYGVPVVDAAAAVLVYHAIAFWVPGLGGLAALGLLQRHPEGGAE
jgi:uncharacterized membrane protein YbhN (UPF0104 family)